MKILYFHQYFNTPRAAGQRPLDIPGPDPPYILGVRPALLSLLGVLSGRNIVEVEGVLMETQIVEHKKSFGKEVIISLVAFANTEGGPQARWVPARM